MSGRLRAAARPHSPLRESSRVGVGGKGRRNSDDEFRGTLAAQLMGNGVQGAVLPAPAGAAMHQYAMRRRSDTGTQPRLDGPNAMARPERRIVSERSSEQALSHGSGTAQPLPAHTHLQSDPHALATMEEVSAALGTGALGATSLALAHDTSAHLALSPHAAHLTVDLPAGDLALHVMVRDGVAQLRGEGAGVVALPASRSELSGALALEGLRLGRYELSPPPALTAAGDASSSQWQQGDPNGRERHREQPRDDSSRDNDGPGIASFEAVGTHVVRSKPAGRQP